MTTRGDVPPTGDEREALARELHGRKNRFFAELVAGGALPLRPGVENLMRECAAAGVRMGIVTTTSRVNVEALLQTNLGPRWRERFAAVVCGEDVGRKKPDPQAYRLALKALDIGPLEAVAIEDSPGGAAAARAADVPVVVSLSSYFAHATFEGVVAIGPGLHQRSGWRPALRPGNADDAPRRPRGHPGLVLADGPRFPVRLSGQSRAPPVSRHQPESHPMALVSLRQVLDHAAEHGYGVPAFNVNNLEQIQAIMEAAAGNRQRR